jgi:hypothetical protein
VIVRQQPEDFLKKSCAKALRQQTLVLFVNEELKTA